MIPTFLRRRAGRFLRREDGNATIEFSIWFTILFVLLATGVEMAYMNLRHAMLERAVDVAVRDIRLGTGAPPTYEDVRDKICDNISIAKDCTGNITLEMVQVDPRNFAALPAGPDCRNVEEDPRPVRQFNYGQDNELMLLRACLSFKPVSPGTGLGERLQTDTQGYSWLVVTSAFVQEPR